MRWEKFSEPIRKLGEWLLNAGLASYVAMILPFFKEGEEFSFKGVLIVVFAIVVGLILIYTAEILKKED